MADPRFQIPDGGEAGAGSLAVCFTNLGPYHRARLRALARRLKEGGGRLIAYEVAGSERKYPWEASRRAEPFAWTTFFPDRALEEVPGPACAAAMRDALERDRPDAVAIVGYARPESMAALRWARRRGRAVVLMSESQAIDRPRAWWKEAIKRRRVRRCDAALVGGPSHRAYLATLGLPAHRIAFGYNAVDHDRFAAAADAARRDPDGRRGLPDRPYFLAVARFVPEKNLPRLVRAFARYREAAPTGSGWDLVLCGDGPDAGAIEAAIRYRCPVGSVHRPGFLQADDLPRWYAFAGAFVLPSLSEPWGLVANEAAACGVPLLVSGRAGCASTLVPDPPGTTGWRFDPGDEDALAAALARVSSLAEAERAALGRRAAGVASAWGPDRFAHGTLEALALAARRRVAREAIR